jgi:hypothetical protein
LPFFGRGFLIALYFYSTQWRITPMTTVTPKTRTITNGSPNDATPVENNFLDLYANDTKLATAVTALESLMMRGLLVSYNSASSVIIRNGRATNLANTDSIVVTSAITVSLTSTGVGGLDFGVEAANTWYYLYLIKRTSDSAVSAVFSLVNEAVTGSIVMPSGYDQKRQLPIAIRNDASGNIIKFNVGEGWPNRPTITYDVATSDSFGAGSTNIVNAGIAGTFTVLDASAFVPPLSRKALLMGTIGGSGGAIALLNTTGGASNGVAFGGGTNILGCYLPMVTNASQQVSYMRQSGAGTVYLDVYGYVVTEL